jgi:hypothetical protein
MTTTAPSDLLVERLTDEYRDVLPPGLVRSCVASVAAQSDADAQTAERLAAYVEGTARTDLDALADAVSRRDDRV